VAKEVDSLAYRRVVVRYIDRNPVAAGLVPRSEGYPYGSARLYGQSDDNEHGWLERSWIEKEVCEAESLDSYVPGRYGLVFGRLPEALARVVEARLRSRIRVDDLDDLVRAAPQAVTHWMQRKARLADGTRPGLPVLDEEHVARAVETERKRATEDWTVGRRNAWTVVHIGLLRQFCGWRLEDLSARFELCHSATCHIAQLHRRMVGSDDSYARRAGVIASRALGAWRVKKSD